MIFSAKNWATLPLGIAMDKLVIGIVAGVALLVLLCTGYLWYLTSGADESERASMGPRMDPRR